MKITNEERLLLRDALSRYPQAFTPFMNDLYTRLGEEDDTVYILTNEDVSNTLDEMEDGQYTNLLTAEERKSVLTRINSKLDLRNEFYWAVGYIREQILSERLRALPDVPELKGKFIEPKGTME